MRLIPKPPTKYRTKGFSDKRQGKHTNYQQQVNLLPCGCQWRASAVCEDAIHVGIAVGMIRAGHCSMAFYSALFCILYAAFFVPRFVLPDGDYVPPMRFVPYPPACAGQRCVIFGSVARVGVVRADDRCFAARVRLLLYPARPSSDRHKIRLSNHYEIGRASCRERV